MRNDGRQRMRSSILKDVRDHDRRRSWAATQRMRRLDARRLIVVLIFVLLFGQSIIPPETVCPREIIEMDRRAADLARHRRPALGDALYRRPQERRDRAGRALTRSPATRSTCSRRSPAAGVGAQTGSIVVTICFAVLCAGAFHIVILREEALPPRIHSASPTPTICARCRASSPNSSLFPGERDRRLRPSRPPEAHLARRAGLRGRHAGLRTDRPRPGRRRAAGALPPAATTATFGNAARNAALRFVPARPPL